MTPAFSTLLIAALLAAATNLAAASDNLAAAEGGARVILSLDFTTSKKSVPKKVVCSNADWGTAITNMWRSAREETERQFQAAENRKVAIQARSLIELRPALLTNVEMNVLRDVVSSEFQTYEQASSALQTISALVHHRSILPRHYLKCDLESSRFPFSVSKPEVTAVQEIDAATVSSGIFEIATTATILIFLNVMFYFSPRRKMKDAPKRVDVNSPKTATKVIERRRQSSKTKRQRKFAKLLGELSQNSPNWQRARSEKARPKKSRDQNAFPNADKENVGRAVLMSVGFA